MFNYQKPLLITIIGIALIASSVFASHIPVLWPPFTVSVLVLGVAIAGLRIISKEEIQASSSEKNPLNRFIRLLKEEEKEIGLLLKEEDDSAEWTERIETDQQHFYTQVEEVRSGLVDMLGMKEYIPVITTFASAERQLNRGLSAAIDSYYEEARNALTKGRDQLRLTLQVLVQTGIIKN